MPYNYTNKFIEFLNGANSIKISGVADFKSMHSLCKKVGLSFFDNLTKGEYEVSYYNLLQLADTNGCAINYTTILVSYDHTKGLSIGWKSEKESEDWYEMKPWTVKQILTSVKGE